MGAWWADAVIYEIYVRSFADGDDDGVGDLRGITAHLDHVARLGADAIWLTPFYPSPMADHGYDVADPRDVDPLFGSLSDLDALVTRAHDLGLRVLIDIVPNHVSAAHAWFTAALAAAPGSPERERFIFRPGRGADGAEPPNNWPSQFGGPAWTRVPDGEWYLHLFTAEQPDLNWRCPDVPADFVRTLRFWLDRGIDGFRIDVAHGLFKEQALPDVRMRDLDLMADTLAPNPMWNQPEVHDIYRTWHDVCADYPHDPVLVGEVWLGDARAVADYVRPDELHLAFNFRLLFAPWDASAIRSAVDRSLDRLGAVGAASTWVLANHDVPRAPTRYGGGADGLRRARAAALVLLALPGPAFLYQGEELGLADVHVPDEAIQDPIWAMTNHAIRGRDGCRVPLPWSGTTPPYGFAGDGTATWLPMPADWAAQTVAAEAANPGSVLELYRRALALRRTESALGSGEMHWLEAPAGVVDFVRPGPDGTGVRCVANLGTTPVPCPAGAVLLASTDVAAGVLAPDTAAWVRA